MAFNNTVIARAAAGIFGLQLGNGTTSAVLAQANSGASLNSIINSAFNDSYGNVSTPVVAAAVVSNLGLTGQAAVDGQSYIVSQLASVPLDQRGAAIADIVNLFASLGTDPTFGTFANDFNARVAASVNYASTPGTGDQAIGPIASGVSFFLGSGQDNMSGTSANDTFNAYIFDNQNTLQSGDFVNGGAGVDTLYADMGSSQNFAVTPRTQNVENIVIRAQSRAGLNDNGSESGDNNVANEARVDVDAQRIVGATRFESNNSRADLIIEDVRILPSQITKDITVAFTQSDPGNVDFGLYFDQASLKASSNSSSTLTLRVIDIAGFLTSGGASPLLDSPYNAISFSIGGVLVTLRDPPDGNLINNAQSYQALLDAINSEIARNPLLNGTVTAALGSPFTVTDALTQRPATGTDIVLTSSAGALTPGNYIAEAGVPANSNLFTAQLPTATSSNDLVAVNVLLDDTGRGSNGGDLVIGGLSVGETSNSRGVDKFIVTVDRTSHVQNMDSTNNWLKEVLIKNGTVNGDFSAYGNVGANGRSLGPIGGGTAQNEALPGAVAQHDSWGFNDVRLIDASAMVGKVAFDAIVTPESFRKYIMLEDTAADPADDNTSTPGQTKQVADFIYSGGANNDTINVQIDGGIAASNSNIQVGREDFSFTINGNGGDDSITLRIVDNALEGGAQNWYGHQHSLQNVAINGGAGNDTIRTPGAGDVITDAGDGNDTIYTDNTGALNAGAVLRTDGGTVTGPIANGPGFGGLANPGGVDLPLGINLSYTNFNLYNTIVPNGQNAMWAFNTDNSVVGLEPAAREISDLKSDANDASNLYRSTFTVTFKGLTSTVTLPITAGINPTDLWVNQQIKAAINLDPVLSKLLVAQDGPAYSMVVKSLIDGDMVAGDLNISASPISAGSLTAAEKASLIGVGAGYGLAAGATDAQIDAALLAGVQAFFTNGDYGTLNGLTSADANFAQNATVLLIGNDSTYSSDNTVTPGAGNDVIVLGTDNAGAFAVGSTLDALDASNDVVAYFPLFGNDTIVNFEEGIGAPNTNVGIDVLDFTGILGDINLAQSNFSQNAYNALNKSISIVPLVTGNGVTANNTATQVATLFADSANPAVLTHVVVVVNPANIGSVYTVTDAIGAGSGASNITAVLAGTIDLADTPWGVLTADNFV